MMPIPFQCMARNAVVPIVPNKSLLLLGYCKFWYPI